MQFFVFRIKIEMTLYDYLLHFSFLVDINEPSTDEISKRNQDIKCQPERNTGRTKKDFSKGRITFEILPL